MRELQRAQERRTMAANLHPPAAPGATRCWQLKRAQQLISSTISEAELALLLTEPPAGDAPAAFFTVSDGNCNSFQRTSTFGLAH